jgi:arsenate reductase
MYPGLEATVNQISKLAIRDERKAILKPLIHYIQTKVDTKQACVLNFICTHNSRRSQLAQIWAQTAADLAGVSVNCLSGGVEVTAFNERAVASIQRSGFKVEQSGSENPRYTISHSEDQEPIVCFSKLYDDTINQAEKFAAIMVCSDADENCPFIPGTEARIPIRYEDPKAFDGTALETSKYDERSMQIAAEMFYVFNSIKPLKADNSKSSIHNS